MLRLQRSTGPWRPRPAQADNSRELTAVFRNLRGGLTAIIVFLTLVLPAGCSNLTGWTISGTEKSALPTTKVYLVMENIETVPENLRTQGEIYVDAAYFGRTSRPTYYKFVGNGLVVGMVQIEKEKPHTLRVDLPGYEPFEHTRHFGALSEYSISFRMKRLEAEPAVAWEIETESERPEEKQWYEFWRWFGE